MDDPEWFTTTLYTCCVQMFYDVTCRKLMIASTPHVSLTKHFVHMHVSNPQTQTAIIDTWNGYLERSLFLFFPPVSSS